METTQIDFEVSLGTTSSFCQIFKTKQTVTIPSVKMIGRPVPWESGVHKRKT